MFSENIGVDIAGINTDMIAKKGFKTRRIQDSPGADYFFLGKTG
jgi:hypothetical protein